MTRTPIAWKDLSSVVLLDAGVYQDERGVCVPFRLPGGAVHNVKVHARGRSWWATSGLPLIPFGLELVPDRSDDREGRLVWLAEGESDALCLREHYAEWRDRPVDVLGLPGSSSWRPAWSRHLSTYTGVSCSPTPTTQVSGWRRR